MPTSDNIQQNDLEISMMDILSDDSIKQAEEIKTDFLRSQLHTLMELKIPAPNDEVLVGELSQRLTRLAKLEDELEQIAQAFNCSKDEILANTIENVKIYHQLEQAQKQLDDEREEFIRKLKVLDDENQRLLQGLDTLKTQAEAQTEKLEKIREENKRISFWDKLFGRTEPPKETEELEEELESEDICQV